MAYFVLSEKADSHLREIIVERDADNVFVGRFRDYLETIAENTVAMTEVAKLPYPPNRLMANFEIADGSETVWGWTVTLRRMPDEIGIGNRHFDDQRGTSARRTHHQ